MNQQEFKVAENIAKNLEEINTSIKGLNDTLKKFLGKTKNGVLHDIADDIKEIAKKVDRI